MQKSGLKREVLSYEGGLWPGVLKGLQTKEWVSTQKKWSKERSGILRRWPMGSTVSQAEDMHLSKKSSVALSSLSGI